MKKTEGQAYKRVKCSFAFVYLPGAFQMRPSCIIHLTSVMAGRQKKPGSRM